MHRTAAAALALASLLISAPAASADAGSMVPGPTQTEVAGGKKVIFGTHGDRIPRGSDTRMRRRLPRMLAAELPVTWCGTERTTDDSSHDSASGPRFKVVYAYANDQANRFADYRNMIQNDVATVRQWVVAASGGNKSVRFDMGTDCGPAYVDVMVVRLPLPKAQYLASDNRAQLVYDHVQARVASIPGRINTLIYADGLYANDGVTGSGLLTMDEQPGSANMSNLGEAAAMLWGHGGNDFSLERQTTFLHEVTHNLGAVQDGAPNSTGAGHCYEMYDVMCYDDGGPSTPGLEYNCAETFPLAYECGGDDYFNPSPEPGSYLATHWNVYNSEFLCTVASCIAEAGSTPPPTNPGPTTTPPPTSPGTPPDPGAPVGDGAQAWLDGFLKDTAARVKKVGLPGLSRGKAVAVRGTAPNGYSVQVDLMWGAAAIAGGSLDVSGKARLKVPRLHRKLLSKKRKVRLVVQGVIRGAAGGGPPSLKKVPVTLKAPPKKKRGR